MPRKAEKKKPTTRKRKAPAKRTSVEFSSRVGNGTSLFIDGSLDQRSLPARRYREITYSIGSDLGGFDNLSEFQKQLTRRSAALSVLCELDECKLAKGEVIDASRFGVMVNVLNRLAGTLGVRRVAIDAIPTLESYLAAKRAQEAAQPRKPDDGDD